MSESTSITTRGLSPCVTGAVAIGRNEGERLQACLQSLTGHFARIVYVDSGSTDGSVEFAHSLGIEVVELDMSKPFTMARGRNAGFSRLAELVPEVEYVQFVDGDCEVDSKWIPAAVSAMQQELSLGSVCGHRTELFPERSLYNRLTDMDWRGPTGEVSFCGGDVLMRSSAFRQCKGYQEQMIAGEDPEICVRLRELGWILRRLDLPMTRHDVAMLHFGQWWKRSLRSGHAYAEGAWMHRHSTERPWRHNVRRNFFWGLLLPAFIAATLLPSHGVSLTLCLLYPVWIWQIARGRIRLYGDSAADAWLYGTYCMLGKFPSALGQILFCWRMVAGQQSHLIEYKMAHSAK